MGKELWQYASFTFAVGEGFGLALGIVARLVVEQRRMKRVTGG